MGVTATPATKTIVGVRVPRGRTAAAAGRVATGDDEASYTNGMETHHQLVALRFDGTNGRRFGLSVAPGLAPCVPHDWRKDESRTLRGF